MHGVVRQPDIARPPQAATLLPVSEDAFDLSPHRNPAPVFALLVLAQGPVHPWAVQDARLNPLGTQRRSEGRTVVGLVGIDRLGIRTEQSIDLGAVVRRTGGDAQSPDQLAALVHRHMHFVAMGDGPAVAAGPAGIRVGGVVRVLVFPLGRRRTGGLDDGGVF